MDANYKLRSISDVLRLIQDHAIAILNSRNAYDQLISTDRNISETRLQSVNLFSLVSESITNPMLFTEIAGKNSLETAISNIKTLLNIYNSLPLTLTTDRSDACGSYNFTNVSSQIAQTNTIVPASSLNQFLLKDNSTLTFGASDSRITQFIDTTGNIEGGSFKINVTDAAFVNFDFQLGFQLDEVLYLGVEYAFGICVQEFSTAMNTVPDRIWIETDRAKGTPTLINSRFLSAGGRYVHKILPGTEFIVARIYIRPQYQFVGKLSCGMPFASYFRCRMSYLK